METKTQGRYLAAVRSGIMAMEGHRLVLACLALGGLAGCRSAPVPELPTYGPVEARYAPATGTDNAFDGYALAALAVEGLAGRDLSRVSFTPEQRLSEQKRCEPYVRQIARAATRSCRFEFTPRGTFDPVPYARGWRLLGDCLCWDLQQAVVANSLDRAVSDAILATRFGFDLTGGGAVEATVGLHIVDDARRALLPALDRLSAKQLRTLESGLKGALERRPPISQAIDNERADTHQAIQDLQDHARGGTLASFETAFGPDVREPIEYLQNLGPDDPKRAEFFKTLAEYTDALDAYAARIAGLPAVVREKVAAPPLPSNRAWRRLAKYVALAPLPLLRIDDVTLARTRLFVIVAELERRRKLGMPLPASLGGFSKPLSIDPYTGAPFIYRTDGEDFKVYSVGQDGLDNAGQTDAAFLEPDLTLER